MIISVEDAERVRLVTLRRPEAKNAFNAELYLATADALEETAERDDLAVAVITGCEGSFSAGVDLAEMGKIGSGEASEDSTKTLGYGFQRFLDIVERFPKPLIAAVNGYAVGIGLTMLPYCDLVLVAESARMRGPFARLGVVPEAGSSHTLAAVMGRQAAAYALYTSEWIDAQTAVDTGLAWRTCSDDALLDEALAVARQIARMPVVSLVETKRLLLADRGDAAAAARAREEEVFGRLTGAPANREAIAAFLEKREPDFTNLPPE